MDGSSKETCLTTIQRLKEQPAAPGAWLPAYQYGRKIAELEPVNFWDLARPDKILLLTTWRRAENPEATRGWLADEVLKAANRLLFWVKGLDGTAVGTVGLTGLDVDRGQVEITDLVRGVSGVLPGVMYAATQALLAWSFQTFGLKTAFLVVPAENAAARRLAERCGFVEVSGTGESGKLRMEVARANWMAGHRADRAA